MYKHEIIFTLDTTEKLIIRGKHSDEACCCCCEAEVTFLTHDNPLQLGTICFGTDITTFAQKLESAIQNKLPLDKSITHGLGYAWNVAEHYASNQLGKVPHYVYEKRDNVPYESWVGHTYEVLATPSACALGTWIYNDEVGNIIFEVAPIYPWHRYDPETEPLPENFIPYEQFMKEYKPCLVRKIPVSVARTWMQQAQHASKTLYDMLAEENAPMNNGE